MQASHKIRKTGGQKASSFELQIASEIANLQKNSNEIKDEVLLYYCYIIVIVIIIY